MNKRIKKIILIAVGIIAALFILEIIWWYFPVKRIQLAQFRDSNAVVDAEISSRYGSPMRKLLVSIAEEKALREMPAGFKQRVVRRGISIAFPQEIMLEVISKSTAEKPVYLVGLDFGRAIKLFRKIKPRLENQIFQGRPVSESEVNGYRFISREEPDIVHERAMNAGVWIDSGLVMCSSPEYLRKLLEQYKKSSHPEETALAPISVKLDNQTAYLTDKIRGYEKKYNYEIFSSIDRVQSVDLEVNTQNKDAIQGKMIFHGKSELSEDDPMISDVNFFYGVLRRKLRPEGIELRGEESHSGKDVKLTMELTGFSSALSQLQNLSKEEK